MESLKISFANSMVDAYNSDCMVCTGFLCAVAVLAKMDYSEIVASILRFVYSYVVGVP